MKDTLRQGNQTIVALSMLQKSYVKALAKQNGYPLNGKGAYARVDPDKKARAIEMLRENPDRPRMEIAAATGLSYRYVCHLAFIERTLVSTERRREIGNGAAEARIGRKPVKDTVLRLLEEMPTATWTEIACHPEVGVCRERVRQIAEKAGYTRRSQKKLKPFSRWKFAARMKWWIEQVCESFYCNMCYAVKPISERHSKNERLNRMCRACNTKRCVEASWNARRARGVPERFRYGSMHGHKGKLMPDGLRYHIAQMMDEAPKATFTPKHIASIFEIKLEVAYSELVKLTQGGHIRRVEKGVYASKRHA